MVSRQELISNIKCILEHNEVVLSQRVVSRQDGHSSLILLYNAGFTVHVLHNAYDIKSIQQTNRFRPIIDYIAGKLDLIFQNKFIQVISFYI